LASPEAVKRLLGVVPEDLALYEHLTAAETLAFVGQVHGLPATTIRARTAELLALMELEAASGQLVADYSHGMRKKTSLAAALLPRRAVRGDRRGRLPPGQGPPAGLRGARRDDLPHLPRPRGRRAALRSHRRHPQGAPRRAGADRRAAHRDRRRDARGDLP